MLIIKKKIISLMKVSERFYNIFNQHQIMLKGKQKIKKNLMNNQNNNQFKLKTNKINHNLMKIKI